MTSLLSDNNVLVGHVPIEISSLCYHFLHEFPGNNIDAVITGKRHREVGLVVPAKYIIQRSLSDRQTSF